MLRIAYLIPLAFLFTLGCNQTTEDPATKTTGPKNQKVISLTYPHKKGFVLEHGESYLKDKKQCLSCHGEDGSGGNTGISCLKCHSTFPHVSNFATAAVHGPAYKNNSASCATCHGSDWQGGKVQVSCSQCHAGFPHPSAWAVPSNHGQFYVKNKETQNCAGCHTVDSNHPTALACNTCHQVFPHPKRFNNGKIHKPLAKTYEGQCTLCHRDYKANLPSFEEGCATCHEDDGVKVEGSWIMPPATPSPPPGDNSGRAPNSSKAKKKK